MYCNSIINSRKKEPDYSQVIPIAVRISYINPTGKLAYRDIDIDPTCNLKAGIQSCLNNIAESTSTPPIIID